MNFHKEYVDILHEFDLLSNCVHIDDGKNMYVSVSANDVKHTLGKFHKAQVCISLIMQLHLLKLHHARKPCITAFLNVHNFSFYRNFCDEICVCVCVCVIVCVCLCV